MKNRKLAFIVFAALTLVVANSFVYADPGKKTTGTDNQLTKKEKKEGWILLFNGTSLDGWRTYKNIPGSWNITNNTICSQKPAGDQNPDLISTDTYENFELTVEWNLSPLGNSGIMYMATEEYDHPYESGPEYQLIDDDNFPQKIEDWQKTGAAYAIQPPLVKAAKAPGQWNKTTIIVNKGHVEHWLNGQKVADYQLWSDTWKQAVANGKWKNEPGYGATQKGHIAFQASHSGVDGSGVCFKNIKIKLL
jgi:hypothetical protein